MRPLPFAPGRNLIRILRQRHFWKNMEYAGLRPPSEVRGMRELRRDAFDKTIKVPLLRVQTDIINRVLPLVKQFLLKMEKLRPVRSVDGDKQREILLHPLPVNSWGSPLPIKELAALDVTKNNFSFTDLPLTYDNWRADEIFKSVLPKEEEGLTSYSRIGHVVHLNLRDHLLPFKSLIGAVLQDKVPGCRTVVNKTSNIDNIYRNFQLELLSGEPDYQVVTKENGVNFEFDFSRVYWNPRLCTEHERIVQMLLPGDVLYDVFAGVGPFCVPAAKRGITIMANDLNPESFRWLKHNVEKNKCSSRAKLFNRDGRAFLLEDVKADLWQRWTEAGLKGPSSYAIHITMNLPALALEFLDVFRGLFAAEAKDLDFKSPFFNYPVVHVYTFAQTQADTKKLIHQAVEEKLGVPLEGHFLGVYFVRNVAPNKDMYRLMFRLSWEILTTLPGELDFDRVEEDATEELTTRKRSAAQTDKEAQGPKIKCI